MFVTLTGFIHLITLVFYLHPIHVSVTEIDFDKKDKALEIMMRVFIDDLELSLRNSLTQPELNILTPDKGTSTDDLIENYIKEHFKVTLDDKHQKVHYLGHERESEAFILYMEVPDVESWKTVSVFNDIIMSTHNDQSNLVHVYVNEEVKSLRLTKNTPAGKLSFDNL
jgi:hypothetical protein